MMWNKIGLWFDGLLDNAINIQSDYIFRSFVVVSLKQLRYPVVILGLLESYDLKEDNKKGMH